MNVLRRGCILVISGPSGVGKDTIIRLLVDKYGLQKLPAYTTRPRRPTEIDGTDYHFISHEAFQTLEIDRPLFDRIEVSGNYYGTPVEEFEKVIEEGKRAVLHLAVNSAIALKSIIPSTVPVFVFPPSGKALVERLKKRGMTQSEIETRLRDDPSETHLALSCDFIVVNYDDEEDQTAERIAQFLGAC